MGRSVAEDQLLLAVAGDNTKTDVAILEPDGTLHAAVRGPGASPDLLGLPGCVAELGAIIERAWGDARMGVIPRRAGTGLYFLAGVNSEEMGARLAGVIAQRGWSERTHVANDVFATLWAANGKGEGVAVVVGAGINCVGQLSSGATARFACLGPLSGDAGDGRSLATAAVAAAVRAEDGRGSPTSLCRLLAQYFGMCTATEVAVAFHDGEIDALRLLDVVPLVVHAAAAHDAVAEELLDRHASEVAGYVIAAARRLEVADQAFDAVLAGSMMDQRWLPVSVAGIRARLAAAMPHARVTVSADLPVAGAALACLAAVGAGPAAAERLRGELVAERLHVVGGSAFLNLPGQ